MSSRPLGATELGLKLRRRARRANLVDVIEAAYDLDDSGGDQPWAQHLVEAFRPGLDRGAGVGSYFSDRSVAFESVVGLGLPEGWTAAMDAIMRSEVGRFLQRPSRPANTARRGVGLARWRAADPMRTFWSRYGVVDGVGIVANDGGDRVVTFFAPMLSVARLDARMAQQYERISAHISAGWRLRRSLRSAAAVLSPSGKVLHAEGDAKEASARELLQRAARAVDRARGPLRRRDQDEAIGLWRVLAAGTWSIVDQFESDGRRYLVAHENRPSVPGPAGLDLREKQILTYTALGHSLKLIAYELGISLPSVARARTGAMRKMRLRSRADVTRLITSAGALS